MTGSFHRAGQDMAGVPHCASGCSTQGSRRRSTVVKQARRQQPLESLGVPLTRYEILDRFLEVAGSAKREGHHQRGWAAGEEAESEISGMFRQLERRPNDVSQGGPQHEAEIKY